MKDPYLKPVIIGGLVITILSIVCVPGIFLWAPIGGYITVRISNRTIKDLISFCDAILLGLFSGIIGSTCLDIITVISFYDFDNRRDLIRMLEKNWPKEMYPIPNFSELLPSIFLTTCLLIIIITVALSILGALIGRFITKQKTNKPIVDS